MKLLNDIMFIMVQTILAQLKIYFDRLDRSTYIKTLSLSILNTFEYFTMGTWIH